MSVSDTLPIRQLKIFFLNAFALDRNRWFVLFYKARYVKTNLPVMISISRSRTALKTLMRI